MSYLEQAAKTNVVTVSKEREPIRKETEATDIETITHIPRSPPHEVHSVKIIGTDHGGEKCEAQQGVQGENHGKSLILFVANAILKGVSRTNCLVLSRSAQ